MWLTRRSQRSRLLKHSTFGLEMRPENAHAALPGPTSDGASLLLPAEHDRSTHRYLCEPCPPGSHGRASSALRRRAVLLDTALCAE